MSELHEPDETRTYPEAGDWVMVWGQVKTDRTHPEDVAVEFFSHSEQFLCHVRTDRVVPVETIPEFAPQCTVLLRYAGGDNGLLTRCVRHMNHGTTHRDRGGNRYGDGDVVGHIEEG